MHNAEQGPPSGLGAGQQSKPAIKAGLPPSRHHATPTSRDIVPSEAPSGFSRTSSQFGPFFPGRSRLQPSGASRRTSVIPRSAAPQNPLTAPPSSPALRKAVLDAYIGLAKGCQGPGLPYNLVSDSDVESRLLSDVSSSIGPTKTLSAADFSLLLDFLVQPFAGAILSLPIPFQTSDAVAGPAPVEDGVADGLTLNIGPGGQTSMQTLAGLASPSALAAGSEAQGAPPAIHALPAPAAAGSSPVLLQLSICSLMHWISTRLDPLDPLLQDREAIVMLLLTAASLPKAFYPKDDIRFLAGPHLIGSKQHQEFLSGRKAFDIEAGSSCAVWSRAGLMQCLVQLSGQCAREDLPGSQVNAASIDAPLHLLMAVLAASGKGVQHAQRFVTQLHDADLYTFWLRWLMPALITACLWPKELVGTIVGRSSYVPSGKSKKEITCEWWDGTRSSTGGSGSTVAARRIPPRQDPWPVLQLALQADSVGGEQQLRRALETSLRPQHQQLPSQLPVLFPGRLPKTDQIQQAELEQMRRKHLGDQLLKLFKFGSAASAAVVTDHSPGAPLTPLMKRLPALVLEAVASGCGGHIASHDLPELLWLHILGELMPPHAKETRQATDLLGMLPALLGIVRQLSTASQIASVPELCKVLLALPGDGAEEEVSPHSLVLCMLLKSCLEAAPEAAAHIPQAALSRLLRVRRPDASAAPHASLVGDDEPRTSVGDLVASLVTCCARARRASEMVTLIMQSLIMPSADMALDEDKQQIMMDWRLQLLTRVSGSGGGGVGEEGPSSWSGGFQAAEASLLSQVAASLLGSGPHHCGCVLQLCDSALAAALAAGQVQYVRELACARGCGLLIQLGSLLQLAGDCRVPALSLLIRLLPMTEGQAQRGSNSVDLRLLTADCVAACLLEMGDVKLSGMDLQRWVSFLAAQGPTSALAGQLVLPGVGLAPTQLGTEHPAASAGAAPLAAAPEGSLLLLHVQGVVAASYAGGTADSAAVAAHVQAVARCAQGRSVSPPIKTVLASCLSELSAVLASLLGAAPEEEEVRSTATLTAAVAELLALALGLPDDQHTKLMAAVSQGPSSLAPPSDFDLHQDGDHELGDAADSAADFVAASAAAPDASVKFFSPGLASSLKAPPLPHQLTQPGHWEQARQWVLRLQSPLQAPHRAASGAAAAVPMVPPAPARTGSSSPGSLVLTPTALMNLAAVETALRSPGATPVLLEGATGVGKSATVMRAVEACGSKLIRFNLSSSTTPDDLIGRISLQHNKETGSDCFVQLMGPFTQAYRDGSVLLLDELNLAPDDVLKVMEQALDTGELTVGAAKQASSVTIQRHPGFRLFATQNPASGEYRGARERLSPALMDRFTPVVFKELPAGEWKQVVEETLLAGGVSPGLADQVAKLLVPVHSAVQSGLRSPSMGLAEASARYATITIRELLEWTSYLLAKHGRLGEAAFGSQLHSLLPFTAVQTYLSRFRTASTRERLASIISDALPPSCNLRDELRPPKKWTYTSSRADTHAGTAAADSRTPPNSRLMESLVVDGVAIDWPGQASDVLLQRIQQCVPGCQALGHKYLSYAAGVHSRVRSLMVGHAFVANHGLHSCPDRLLVSWVEAALNTQRSRQDAAGEAQRPLAGAAAPLSEFALAGWRLYARQLRHASARHELWPCFESKEVRLSGKAKAGEEGKLMQPEEVSETAARDATAGAAAPGAAFDLPTRPFAVTGRCLATWKLLGSAVQGGRPVLLTGNAGCGKAAIVRALTCMGPGSLMQYQMSPETEPSDLVGQFSPSDQPGGPRIAWADGVVTRAVQEGGWLLLTHLEAADPRVLERLNPLLEADPMWVLTERGDSQPLQRPAPTAGSSSGQQQQQELQVFATLTPPARHSSREVGLMGTELTPALANRFSIVHVEDPMTLPSEEFAAEIQQMCTVLCSDRCDTDPKLAASACLLIRDSMLGGDEHSRRATSGKTLLTMRTFVRLLDSAYRLQWVHPELSFARSLWAAFLLIVQPQCMDAVGEGAVQQQLFTKLQMLLQLQPGESSAHSVSNLALQKKKPVAATSPSASTDSAAVAAGAPSVLHRLNKGGIASAQAGPRRSASSNPDQQAPYVMLGSHVLTPSRKVQAEALMSCVDCQIPVLLEGEAAVGKTSLVAALAMEHGVPLLRINNSESTSAQDYFGAHVPDGRGGFSFQRGPLVEAMEGGHWLLVDEINLAPPAVISMLVPLLEGQQEGQLHVPGTSLVVVAAPGFRIFATGNSSKYAGRQPLPMSVRSRLQVIPIGDFPADELAVIIAQRFQHSEHLASQKDAEQLAQLYRRCPPGVVTMREVIKAVRRRTLFRCSLLDAVLSLLSTKAEEGSDAAANILEGVQFVAGWGKARWPEAGQHSVKQKADGVELSNGSVKILLPREGQA